ncbi:radical SAM protein [Vibrio parahaemolyticus]|uniref:radical SAM protein n=1 Tax=Vibrio parahaemolyticus TaxID=670 RepID=UPI00112335BA|nr:radical SAM protein [Vibrio parahaemolyticus]TOJ30678.1 hypothetical protein CGI43_03290 [Vibrio parahaemolyticus]
MSDLNKLLYNEIFDHVYDKLNNGLSKVEIILTRKCNLQCSYCYQRKDRIKKAHRQDSIKFEDIRKSIDLLFNELTLHSKHIGFFGGEPLLEWGLLKRAVQYAESKSDAGSITYNITTNATILPDDFIDFFKNRNLALLISIDGTKAIHNRNRKYKNGQGTFNDIILNTKKLVENNIYFSIRLTVTPKTLPTISEFLIWCRKNIPNTKIIIGPATGYNWAGLEGKMANAMMTCLDFERKSTLKIEFYDYDNDLGYECGAGRTHIAVDTNGDIYPCAKFAFLDKSIDYKVGNVTEGIFNCKICDKISQAVQNGYCPAVNLEENDTFFSPSLTLATYNLASKIMSKKYDFTK